jgi:hypothetical protein
MKIRLPHCVFLIIACTIGGCDSDRYSRVVCDFGNGDALVVSGYVGTKDRVRVIRAPDLDKECRARMGIKDAPE